MRAPSPAATSLPCSPVREDRNLASRGASEARAEGPARPPLSPWPPAGAAGSLPSRAGPRESGSRWRVSSAGDVSYFSIQRGEESPGLNEALRELGIPALTLRGAFPLRPGVRTSAPIAQAVKRVMDPDNRFPGIDE